MKEKKLGWTFDTETSAYDKMRPGYVGGMYQVIFNYAPVNTSSHVLEIGIGSGQATLPFLQRGCRLTAVESGSNFSELCREKFKEYPKFSVVVNKFEHVDFEGEIFDMIFSATAFHWIPEEIGYSKVYSLLKKGGAFVQFANHPCRDMTNLALTEDIDNLYAAYFYKYYNRSPERIRAYREEQAQLKAAIAEKYGFEETHYALFHRTRTFSAKEYVLLLNTYSDHIAIEQKLRTEFFTRIEEAINRHGGEITLNDTIDLQLAKKK